MYVDQWLGCGKEACCFQGTISCHCHRLQHKFLYCLLVSISISVDENAAADIYVLKLNQCVMLGRSCRMAFVVNWTELALPASQVVLLWLWLRKRNAAICRAPGQRHAHLLPSAESDCSITKNQPSAQPMLKPSANASSFSSWKQMTVRPCSTVVPPRSPTSVSRPFGRFCACRSVVIAAFWYASVIRASM